MIKRLGIIIILSAGILSYVYLSKYLYSLIDSQTPVIGQWIGGLLVVGCVFLPIGLAICSGIIYGSYKLIRWIIFGKRELGLLGYPLPHTTLATRKRKNDIQESIDSDLVSAQREVDEEFPGMQKEKVMY